MNRFNHIQLPPDELSASNVEGAYVYGLESDHGRGVSYLHAPGQSAQTVVDVGDYYRKISLNVVQSDCS